MGKVEAGHGTDGGIGLEDRLRGARVRARGQDDLGVDREVGQGPARDGRSRGGPEEQHARDQRRRDRHSDEGRQRPSWLTDHEPDGVSNEGHATAPAVRRPSRIR